MNIFKRKTELAVNQGNEILVPVPDIKDYLVKEYERVNALKLENERLEQLLAESEEIKLKYSAAMVTLKEYSDRLEQATRKMEDKNFRIEKSKEELRKANDAVNSYKIKLNETAITKEEITEEIIEEVKSEIIAMVNMFKGNLSKKTVCNLISKYKKAV